MVNITFYVYIVHVELLRLHRVSISTNLEPIVENSDSATDILYS